MASLYPNFPVVFSPKVNLEDTVIAEDVNRLYEEVTAIANVTGLTPQTRSTAWTSGTFDTSTTTYSSVGERIRNTENGTYIVYNDYVSKSGGTTIVSSGTSVVNLSLKLRSSQTANMLELKDTSDAILASVSAAGTLRAVLIDGGSA